MSFGVTPYGFVKKSLTICKTEIETDWRSAFGPTIDLTPEGPIGQIIGIHAKRESDLWDLAEDVYTARNPHEATGAAQDNLYGLVGLPRLDSSPSYFEHVLLWGDSGTLISAGRQAAQSQSSNAYELQDDVILSDETCRGIRLTVVRGSGVETFTLELDAITMTYTSGESDTQQQVVDALLSAIGASAFTGVASDLGSGVIEIVGGTEDFTVDSLTVNLEVVLVANAGRFNCTVDGPIAVPVGSLDTIYTPVSGWLYVVAPYDGTAGSNVETDYEYRLRQSSFYSAGKATEEAIRSAIMAEVAGIISCSITSNREDTEVDGHPPHSFSVVVEGGADADIANAIWRTQPAAIRSHGSTTVSVIDSQGFNQSVKFSRPTKAYIYVKVKRDLYESDGVEKYPLDGDNLVKQAIYDWSVGEFASGKDVIPQRISIPVYSVPGIGEVEIEIASVASLPGTPVYQTTKIVIGATELAVFSVDRITVEDLT